MKVNPIEKHHLFRIALEVAKAEGDVVNTAEQVAAALEVTVQHLKLVINEVRDSPRIATWVDLFIERKLDRLYDYLAEQKTRSHAA